MYFISQIQKKHDIAFGCSFTDMEYQSEIIKGFQSVFYFKCKVCNIVEKLYTENNKKTDTVTINNAAVNACQATGLLLLDY